MPLLLRPVLGCYRTEPSQKMINMGSFDILWVINNVNHTRVIWSDLLQIVHFDSAK